MISREKLESVRKLLRNAGAIRMTTTPATLQELAERLDFVTIEVAAAALTRSDLPKPINGIRGEKRKAFVAEFEAFLRKIASDIESGAMPAPKLPQPSRRAMKETKMAAKELIAQEAMRPDAGDGASGESEFPDARHDAWQKDAKFGEAGPSEAKLGKTRFGENMPEEAERPGAPIAAAKESQAQIPIRPPGQSSGSPSKNSKPTARLTVQIPMDVYIRLRVKAVLGRTTITKMVTDWARRTVEGDI